jgi:hypothetical protein
VRRREFAGGAEDVTLARLGKPRPDGEHVVGAERERPAGARIARGDGQHHPPERGQAERVAAELAWLQDPVEPGLGELPAELGRVMPEPFRLVLLGADGRDQGPGPFDDGLGRQVRFGEGNHRYESDVPNGRAASARAGRSAGPWPEHNAGGAGMS